MKNAQDELLLALCIDHILKHGGKDFLMLVLSAKTIVQRAEITEAVSQEGTISSLDEDIWGDGVGLLDRIAHHSPNPEELLCDSSRRRFIEEMLEELPLRHQDMICRLFGLRNMEEESLTAVGRHHQISRERIGQLRGKILRKFRHRMHQRGVTIDC